MRKSIKSWLQIKNIEGGIIEMKDGAFCKVVEVCPINFSLKSQSEQESILYAYKNFLNTCDFNIQILVQSKKGNLDDHITKIEENIQYEKEEKIKKLMREYINMIKDETLKSALTKRFFIVFSSETNDKVKGREQALIILREKALKIKTSLERCGNMIKEFDEDNTELVDIIYTYLNPTTSKIENIKEFNYEYKN